MADQETAASAAFEPARPSRRDPLTAFLTYVGEVSLLLAETFREIARGRVDMRDLIQQMSFIGVNSIAIALVTSFASGAVIALYFSDFLQKYGVSSLVGAVVGLAITRELAPVLTGVVVAARAGSAIAAEIGTMSVTEQIDALRSLAVNPVQYLVPPRMLAAIIMLPVVCYFADLSGIFGGYVIAVAHGISAQTYPTSIQQFLEPSDFYRGMFKTVVFGLIIAVVGCHQGFKTRGGATEVGWATTNAVVISIVLVYISDYFLANALFTGGSQ